MNQPPQVSDNLLTLLAGALGGAFGMACWVAIAKCFGWI